MRKEREELKKRDAEREADPGWFKKRDMLGMMLYIDNFAGTLRGVGAKAGISGELPRKLCAPDALPGCDQGKDLTAATRFLISGRSGRIWEIWRILRIWRPDAMKEASMSAWILL